MNRVVLIRNIDWDTSDWSEEEELASGICVPDLPKDVETDTDSAGWDEESVCDWLMEKYKFPVNGFEFELKGKK